jgi:hypothetical protein
MSITETERIMQGRVGIDKSERIRNGRNASAASAQSMVSSKSGKNELAPPKLNEKGQLTAEEVAKRISGSVETKEVLLGDLRREDGWISASYAVKTQRGYHPDRELEIMFFVWWGSPCLNVVT